VLIMQDLNVDFRGSSSLVGKLTLTDCRSTGTGGITIGANPAELALIRSQPYTLEFHVSDVIVNYGGLLTVYSNLLLSSSRIKIFGRMEVDVAELAELRGAFCFMRFIMPR
jgi:hypothetical protein